MGNAQQKPMARSTRPALSRRRRPARHRGGGALARRRRSRRHAGVFRSDDYKSDNGFLTSVWGPSLWFTLHIISLNYPTDPTAEDKRQYKKFFDSLQHVLPCGICRQNLCSNLSCTGYGPHVFDSRTTLARFVHKLHQCVNKMLGKKYTVPFEEMRDTYENFRARCNLASNSKSATCRRLREREQRKANNNNNTRRTRRRTRAAKEGGCTDPITGIKSKCTLQIVPIDRCVDSLNIDAQCLCKR